MDNEKAISVLNSFIVINNARIKRYKWASTDSKESFLKKTFMSFQKTSLACKKELRKEIIKLGGTPIEEKSKNTLLHHFWLKFTKFVFNTDLNNIIYSCERNESIIIQSYYEAIYSNLGNLNYKQKAMLNNQYFLINDDHDKMKSLNIHSHRL
ncbi:PA2169 family four-helix-bundle protein [Flavobacterium sp. WC2421]|jgi:uncharacterized protein (TIGR02284 family)|uniref:PA2169 family four-helix-bundle protein n=3 Tax=unclassified Flavobacterium TaxID=196869 RepID=A0AB39W754_9FLAO